MDARPVLLAALALSVLAAGIGAGAPPGPAPQPATGQQIDYDSTLLRVDVAESGDAAWTIEYRVSFDDSNESETAFESLARDIRQNRSRYVAQFASRMNRTAAAAENATGREMTVRNVSVTTETQVTAGVVRYTFDWTNFATATTDRLEVGDAISGLALDSDTTLTLSWPARYGVVEIRPDDTYERRDGIAIWYGQQTFAPDEPRLVLAANAPTPTATASPTGSQGTPTDTPTDGGVTDESGIDPVLVGLLGLLLLGIVAGYLWRTERLDRPGSSTTDDGPAESGGANTDDAGETEAPTAGAADEETPPEELLSNEERVLRLLEENGGRMKQQQVVSELGWTDAKTSQVVGSLRDDEKIEAFRIGRENVLALPGETDF